MSYTSVEKIWRSHVASTKPILWQSRDAKCSLSHEAADELFPRHSFPPLKYYGGGLSHILEKHHLPPIVFLMSTHTRQQVAGQQTVCSYLSLAGASSQPSPLTYLRKRKKYNYKSSNNKTHCNDAASASPTIPWCGLYCAIRKVL